MDPDAALDLATDPYADPTDRAIAAARLVAWVRSGGFLPDFTRFGYRVTHPIYITGRPTYPDNHPVSRGDWYVESNFPDDFHAGQWKPCSGVFDRRYRAVSDAVHRIWMDRDARKEWLAVNGV